MFCSISILQVVTPFAWPGESVAHYCLAVGGGKPRDGHMNNDSVKLKFRKG